MGISVVLHFTKTESAKEENTLSVIKDLLYSDNIFPSIVSQKVREVSTGLTASLVVLNEGVSIKPRIVGLFDPIEFLVEEEVKLIDFIDKQSIFFRDFNVKTIDHVLHLDKGDSGMMVRTINFDK